MTCKLSSMVRGLEVLIHAQVGDVDIMPLTTKAPVLTHAEQISISHLIPVEYESDWRRTLHGEQCFICLFYDVSDFAWYKFANRISAPNVLDFRPPQYLSKESNDQMNEKASQNNIARLPISFETVVQETDFCFNCVNISSAFARWVPSEIIVRFLAVPRIQCYSKPSYPGN